MEKEYYKDSEEKVDYIIQRFLNTEINPVFIPIIGDILLRRRYAFNLNDKLFKRDIDTFIKNVKQIEVKDIGDNAGAFYAKNKKIILVEELL